MIQAVIFDMYETLVTQFCSPMYYGLQIAEDLGLTPEEFLPGWRRTEKARATGGLTFEEVMPKFQAMAKYLASCGVTSFAPASMTLPYETLDAAFRVAAKFHKDAPAGHSRLMGIQMEGPFFSYAKKGAQNGAYLKDPDFDAFEKLFAASEGLLRIVDMAAELPGAVEFAEKASKLCTVSIALSPAPSVLPAKMKMCMPS